MSGNLIMRFLILFLLLFAAGQVLAASDMPTPDKTWVVGVDPDYPPFSIGDSAEKADGFSVELWRAVAAESKLNYSLRVAPFYQLIEEIKNGRIDVLLTIAQSEQRRLYADFTVPMVTVEGVFFGRRSQTAIDYETELSGKSVMVVKDALPYEYAVAKGWQKSLVLIDTAEQGLKLLSEGRHDLMFMGKLPGLQLINKLKLPNIQVLDLGTGLTMNLSFAVRKGETELLAKINNGLASTKSKGVYDKLFDRWFGVYEETRIIDRLLLRYAKPLLLFLVVILFYLYYRHTKVQQQIQMNRQRTQLALEGGQLGMWDWNVPSGKVFFNERWCTMLGYRVDEVAPDLSSWQKLVHPDDWQIINPALNDHLAGKIEHYESEHRMLHKDGMWLWILDRGKVVERDSNGEPVRVVGTHLDITERKNSQVILEKLLQEQSAMLDNDLVGIAKIKNNNIIWANAAFENMLGYSDNGLIGMPIAKWFSSEQEDRIFADACYFASTRKSSYRAIGKQVRKDGGLLWVDISCMVMELEKNELMAVMIDVTEQKQAEDAKREAMDRINKIAGQLPGFVYQYCLKPNGSSCFPFASDGIKDIYRVSPDEVKEDAAKVFAIIHPDDFDRVVGSIVASAKNLLHWQYEYRVKFDDGTIRWLFGNALPNRQEDGSVLWHGFITDITERRKIEALLHDSEVRNALILDCAELATWDWHIPSGRVIFNDQWAKIRGYRPDEIEPHLSQWEKGIHPDDSPKVQALLAEHFQTPNGFFNAEYRVRSKSGQWLWILDRGAVIEYDQNGKPVRMAGTEMDISARKQAEKDLFVSRERLYFALQGANDGMWDWNIEGNEVYYSPRWKTMLGYAEHELANRFETWSKLVDPMDRDNVLQKVRDYIDGKAPDFETEFRMRHKDGRWVDILSRAKLAVDAEGRQLKPRRLIGTHVDISDRKHQEQQRLAQEMALRNTLVREVHHRIKNNIQGITGILRQFAENYPETLNPINQAISQMQSIAVIYGLQGLDSMSRVRLSELLTAIVHGIEALWHTSAPIDIIPGLPEFMVAENERVPLALVLNELISNAVKHAGHPAQINVILIEGAAPVTALIAIHNNGQLPPGFDFGNRRQINIGLNLVASLLPRTGAKLSFSQQASDVVTVLELQSPVINLEYRS